MRRDELPELFQRFTVSDWLKLRALAPEVPAGTARAELLSVGYVDFGRTHGQPGTYVGGESADANGRGGRWYRTVAERDWPRGEGASVPSAARARVLAHLPYGGTQVLGWAVTEVEARARAHERYSPDLIGRVVLGLGRSREPVWRVEVLPG